jgi:hypothetical protein
VSRPNNCGLFLEECSAVTNRILANRLRTETVDFDLHGIVGIRLVNATQADIGAVKRQLGPIQKPLSRAPDILIRFVEKMSFSSTLRYLGVADAGFTEEGFLVFRGKHQAGVKVQIPFDQIGSPLCEIVCESGLPAVPLLIAIINLTALSRGTLPMHASALTYQGKGILITGWAKGGKTETLLAFAANGADYVGDEWIYLSGDGQRMYGIPEPIRIWYWHLQELSRYKAMVSGKDRLRLEALNLFVKALDVLGSSGIGHRSTMLRRLTALVKRQLYVQLPPEKLFGQTAAPMNGEPEKVFFVASHARPDFLVQEMDPREVAHRIVFSLQEERMEFMSYYLKYRFAFPECSNSLIEQAEEIQRKILLQVLANKEAYAVYHPYPFSIPALFTAIQPYCT